MRRAYSWPIHSTFSRMSQERARELNSPFNAQEAPARERLSVYLSWVIALVHQNAIVGVWLGCFWRQGGVRLLPFSIEQKFQI